jgi:hypothetical protein
MKIKLVGYNNWVKDVPSEYESAVIKWIELRRTLDAAEKLRRDDLLEASIVTKNMVEYSFWADKVLKSNITQATHLRWEIVNENY